MYFLNRKHLSIIVRYVSFFILTLSMSTQASTKTFAIIQTSMGTIKLELFKDKAPKTVANFIQYAESAYYEGTLFHRVIPGFMIQAGGFDTNFRRKATNTPIKNEALPLLPNRRGTIAMARTSNPHSATSQFFINVADNNSLNKSRSNAGYAVFGKVVEGMIIADQISNALTKVQNRMSDVPVQPIIIQMVTIQHPDLEKTETKTKKEANKEISKTAK